MGSVPNLLVQRWATKHLFGDATHSCKVRVRQGYVNHLYQHTQILPTSPDATEHFPIIWKGHNFHKWQGQWVATGDWIELQNIQSANWTRDFVSNGGATATVVIDNIAFNEQTGVAGIYHSIDRGWFSPTRGVKVINRPALWTANEWDDVFNGGYQIELWEGYGQGSDVTPVLDSTSNTWSAPAASRTFVGLIEECDMESNPDHITLTCRDFSVLLTDQRVMGLNKAKEIQSPITFASRARTMGEVREFGHPKRSSGTVKSDEDLGAVWLSGSHTDPSHTEWVEIHLPGGHYEDFYAAFPLDGPTMYVSLYAAGDHCHMDNTTSIPEGWVDLSLGTVPGETIPYIKKHQNVWAHPSRRWNLGGHTFDLGDGSILRLSFTNLAKDPEVGAYRAGTDAFYAYRYGKNPTAPGGLPLHAKHWILTDDAADVVRTILLWAGFKEMHVENFGWNIDQPMVFGQDQFFIDVINEILAQGNFCFYLDPPTDHDMSIGVPVFEQQTASRKPGRGMVEIRDSEMLEALQVKWDMSNLPYVIRFRGDASKKGKVLFEDRVKRFMGIYWPPWSGEDYTQVHQFGGPFPKGRLGGVRRQFSQTDGAGKASGLRSDAECLFACILTAIQYALQAVTAQVQTPGRPGIGLNEQISTEDVGTGTNTRVWVASIQSTHVLGPSGAWHMTLGGSLLDTEDMNLIAEDYRYAFRKYVLHKAGR